MGFIICYSVNSILGKNNMCDFIVTPLLAIGATAFAGASAVGSSAAAGAGVGASILGTGVSVVGAIMQGQQNQAMADYQSKVAENQATVAGYQAKEATRQGAIEEKQQRLRVAQIKGQQRTGFAGAGVTVDSGSSMDILADTAYLGEQDALTIRHNAAMKGWSLKAQAANYSAQSGMYSAQGSNAYTSGLINAGGSLLSGAGDAYYRYKQYNANDPNTPTNNYDF